MTNEITPIKTGRVSGLWSAVPGYDLLERIIDVFATRQRLRVIVSSDDYVELKVLWGAIEFCRGSKREFLLEGGPGFCEAMIKCLESSKVTRILERKLLN